MNDWILITEQLPPKYKKVLMTVQEKTWDGKTVEHVVYKVWSGKRNVTAWMPAPKPYKRSENDVVPEV